MRDPRHTTLSILVLVAVILTATATAALAQPPDGPQGTRSVVFRNDCADLDNCFDTSNPGNAVRSGDAVQNSRQTATISIVKNANPADGTDFDFTSDLIDFTLDDADPDDGDAIWDNITFQEVPAGVDLGFVELFPLAWELTSIACAYSGDSIISAIRDGGNLVGVTINPAADDHITCTFNNNKLPTATITIAKNASPADGTDFDFTSDLIDFTLDDAVPDDGDGIWDDITFQEVPAEVPLDFVELEPTFWYLSSIACVYSNIDTVISFIRDDGGSLLGVTVDAAEADDITCTFYNQQVPLYLIYLPFVSQGYTAP